MRRLLLVSFALVALLALLLSWMLRGIESGNAPPARTQAVPAESRPEADLSKQESPPLERGRRSSATDVEAPVESAIGADAPSGIRILLLDAKGDPWPGAALDVRSLHGGVELGLQAITDRAGMIATDIEDPREIVVIALEEELAGIAVYADGPFEPSPYRPRVIVVRAPRSAIVKGTVRDEQGRPVAGARVELDPVPALGLEPFVETFSTVKCDAEADAEGRFVLALSETCFSLTPAADGFDAGETAFACLSNDAPSVVDLTLQGASRELEVEVRAAGQPLESRVLVTATRAPTAAPGDRFPREPLTIQRGGEPRGSSLYSVRISRDGDWSLVVSLAKGFADAKVPVGPGDERIVVDLRPPEPDPHLVRVRGTVSTDGGAPLSAEVGVYHGPDFDWAQSGRSDALGRFEIELNSRETEPLLVLAREPGYGTEGFFPIEVDRLPASIDFVLQPEKIISGIVVAPDGTEIAARVSIHPSSANFTAPSLPGTPSTTEFLHTIEGALGSDAKATEDGAFVFRDLSEGWYEIWARARDGSLGLPPGYAAARAGERNLRIVLGSGFERFVSLAGVIREEGTARPISGARVAAGLARGGVWRSADVFSGEDGSYSLPGCPTETLLLYVDAPGHAILSSEIGPFEPGHRELNIGLPPERTLRLLVLDTAGFPVHGVSVSAADARGKPVVLRDTLGHADDDQVLTDLAGRVDLRGLPAAEVVVMVGRRGEAGRTDPREERFDLRVGLAGIQRIVFPR